MAELGSFTVRHDYTDEWIDAMKTNLSLALEEIGLVAEGYAKHLCPVDTGNLRNSITHSVNDSERYVVIGTNVEYAPYVELGTYRSSAQPFLVPAAQDNMSAYDGILKNRLGA